MMKLIVEQAAAKWYKEQMELQDGQYVRIYIKLGGCGSVHPGLSLGIMQDEPLEIGVDTTVEDVHFFVEQSNLWYLEGNDLTISFDAEQEEIKMVVAK